MGQQLLPRFWRAAVTFSLIVNLILVLVPVAFAFILRPALRPAAGRPTPKRTRSPWP